MIGLVRTTVSPWSSSMSRSTPWVDGCWGPMLMIIVSSALPTWPSSGGGLGLGEAQHRTHLPEAVEARAGGQPLALLGGLGDEIGELFFVRSVPVSLTTAPRARRP